MKLLIIGGTGQIGKELLGKWTGGEAIGVDSATLDITQRQVALDFVARTEPGVVFNTAAFHNVNGCEEDPQKSFMVNAAGAHHVSVAARRTGAVSVFVSTDYVFDGKHVAYEDTAPNPLNIYGASKLAGEIATRIANQKYYIFRTSAVYGIYPSRKGHNFVTLMLQKAKRGESIDVVDDQFTCPTFTSDFAAVAMAIIKKNLPFGTYHLANSGQASWYEFAKKIFEFSGSAATVKPIKTAAGPVERPLISVLGNKKLNKENVASLRPWEDALREYVSWLKINSPELF